MSTRAATRLAWSLCLVCVVLLVASLVLLFLSGGATMSTGTWGTANMAFILPVVILAFTLVGTLVSSRLPGNPIGWICLTIGLSFMLAGAADEYNEYALQTRPGFLPGAEYMAWLENWLWVVPVVLIGTFLPLLFPNGRLLSGRWRVMAWLSGAVLISLSISEAFAPGPLAEAPDVTNPLGIEFARDALALVNGVFLLLPLCFVASALSMILRFRRSVGEERQQLKWFASAAALLAITFPFGLVLSSRYFADFVTLTFAGLPVAVGIAILRYRLYDIDRIINRALVYGALSVSLAAVYFGSVVALQYVFRALTGQESQLAVVASTLAIAALFVPLRRRVQGFVDRRFYRNKYDAHKTLEAFSARLREETELDALTSDLAGVVRDTVQPVHVSLWLKPAAQRKPSE